MFRSRYDGDATTFSPEGKILQVEYAMKAVQQGMPTVGLKSKTHAIIACVMHAPSEFSSHQPKIFKIDQHIGVAISGLTADGRFFAHEAQKQAEEWASFYGEAIPVRVLVNRVASVVHQYTIHHHLRPFGIAGLVGGFDKKGYSLYCIEPTGTAIVFN